MLVIKQFGPVTYAMGTLQEILAGTGIAAKVRALPNDVAGCTLEMGADGKWVGTLGSLSKATADALYASGALANLATGATYREPINGVPYSWGGAGVGWIGPRAYTGLPAGPVARLGDSIVHVTGNAIDVALLQLGFPAISGDYGTGGSRINDQLTKIPAIIAAGYRTIFVEVGTNDVTYGRTAGQMLDDYRILFGMIKSYGIDCRVIYIPPVGTASSVWSAKVLMANIAAYKAASECSFPCYEIYTKMSAAVGGFVSASYTCGGDGIHPVRSKRVVAGTILAEKIKGGVTDPPPARDSAGSLLTGMGSIFANPTNGLAQNWIQQTYGGDITVANSNAEYGGAGSNVNEQTCIFSGGFLAGGFAITYSNSFTGFTPGDRVALFGVVAMDTTIDEPIGVNDCPMLSLMLKCPDSGMEYTAGRTSVGEIRPYAEIIVPPGTTYLQTKLQVPGLSNAVSGSITVKAHNIGLVNLTAAGLA